VKAGKAAALVRAFPGAAVHELPGAELPSARDGVIVPVVLPATAPTIVTGIAAGKVGDRLVLVLIGTALEPGMAVTPIGLIAVIGLADALVFVGVTLSTDGESSTVVGEQFTLVPGIVGSCANGGEASVVAGAPGMVAAENRLENGLGPVKGDDTIAPGVAAVNGLGPVRGDDTIAPGVVGIPMAVVPRVETCA
jgi:hypothetical protein